MPDFVANGKALLEADSGVLVPLATGGIWDWDETGRLGINRSNAATAAAFTSGIIKPCLLLKLRTDLPYGEIADDVEQVSGARTMLEVWGYHDSSPNAIKAMLDRTYTLWQGKRLGGYVCRWAGTYQLPRDIQLDANVERSDYAVFYVKS